MAPRSRPGRASYADLAVLPDDRRVEIIHGVIVDKASPSAEHGRAQFALSVFLGAFARRPGGTAPGGWGIATEVDTEYETHELYRHDVAGWRRERVAQAPAGRPVRIRPDWMCEILSPSNERRDLVDKLRVLQKAGVPYYWILHPEERLLVVYRLGSEGYVVALTATSGETVHAEPFTALPLAVGSLFGDEEPDDTSG